jgi:hypothetical protein
MSWTPTDVAITIGAYVVGSVALSTTQSLIDHKISSSASKREDRCHDRCVRVFEESRRDGPQGDHRKEMGTMFLDCMKQCSTNFEKYPNPSLYVQTSVPAVPEKPNFECSQPPVAKKIDSDK